jgi:hypothetical protein
MRPLREDQGDSFDTFGGERCKERSRTVVLASVSRGTATGIVQVFREICVCVNL